MFGGILGDLPQATHPITDRGKWLFLDTVGPRRRRGAFPRLLFRLGAVSQNLRHLAEALAHLGELIGPSERLGEVFLQRRQFGTRLVEGFPLMLARPSSGTSHILLKTAAKPP